MALAYSVRLSRWIAGLPGLGSAAAARSSSLSSPDKRRLVASPDGRDRPAGGMAPARSLRATFSQVSGAAATSSASTDSRLSPAVRWASLWQSTQ